MKNKLFYMLCLLLFSGRIVAQVSASAQEIVLSDKIMPVDDANIFRDSLYYNWCSSIVKGEDGKYHLIYSRWKRSYTFYAWLTHSTVAHAVADRPEGPYRYVNTIVDLEKEYYQAGEPITAHNPKIEYFEGKYYLYFCSTTLNRDVTNAEMIETAKVGYSHPNWKVLRPNQRVYVASSTSFDKGWTIEKKPLLEPSGPITTLVVNPAITRGPDGRYYLIVKGDKPEATNHERNQAIAVSDYPDKGFVIQSKPVIEDWDTEDVSMWYDSRTKRFYAIFHAHTYVGMMSSNDGLNWQKAQDFVVTRKRIERNNGQAPILPERMERPFLFFENGEAKVLSVAVKKGDDAYIVMIPFEKR